MAVDVEKLAEEKWMEIYLLLEKFCDESKFEYNEQYRFMYLKGFIDGYKKGKEEK